MVRGMSRAMTLQNHPTGNLGGWATPWSAKEILGGQRQRVDIPAHAKIAHKDLPPKRLEIARHVQQTTQSVKGLN